MPTPGRRGRALVLWAGLAFRTQGCRHTTPSDINLDNEITIKSQDDGALLCQPPEVTEGTSAVGRASSPNSRLPSQVLTTPTPLDINLDNEITNQVTALFFFFFFSSFVVPLDINLDNEITNQVTGLFFFFFFLFFFCSSIGHQFGQ